LITNVFSVVGTSLGFVIVGNISLSSLASGVQFIARFFVIIRIGSKSAALQLLFFLNLKMVMLFIWREAVDGIE